MKPLWKTSISTLGCAALLAGFAACQKNENAGGAGTPAAAAPATTGSGSPAAANKPPFGFLHSPEEGATIKPGGSWAYGWVLDDSGIAQITLQADTGATSPVILGQPFPGVAQNYPGYPDADKAGFGFPFPKLGSGIHTLTVTIVAKDGGRTEIRRQVRVP